MNASPPQLFHFVSALGSAAIHSSAVTRSGSMPFLVVFDGALVTAVGVGSGAALRRIWRGTFDGARPLDGFS